MSSPKRARAVVGLRCPAPIFAVRDLEAAMAFYERLGFDVRKYDAGYGYAEREGLHIHLRASPELEPFGNYSEAYVEEATSPTRRYDSGADAQEVGP
jgi:catechol 2,3-dioxygenase-like lactoylglutathione lyase family enzyme